MEKLMTDQSLKSKQTTLKDSLSVTSSQELVDGVTHSNWQDGIQLDLFGQEVRHANHSQSQETTKASQTNDTLHQSSQSLSPSASLQSYLENKLAQQLGQDGSTIYKLTWKKKVTPQQWSYCQLAASAPRTKENDCSSYPTPTASTGGASKNPDNPRGVNGGNPLATAASLVPYPTPSTQDNPQVRGEGAAANHPSRGTTLGGAARLLNAEMENKDQYRLNPRFSLWLMGFPIEWAYCGERVTLSSRKSQRKS
jgi:hypothetical protein